MEPSFGVVSSFRGCASGAELCELFTRSFLHASFFVPTARCAAAFDVVSGLSFLTAPAGSFEHLTITCLRRTLGKLTLSSCTSPGVGLGSIALCHESRAPGQSDDDNCHTNQSINRPIN